jgi:hypothetical protein
MQGVTRRHIRNDECADSDSGIEVMWEESAVQDVAMAEGDTLGDVPKVIGEVNLQQDSTATDWQTMGEGLGHVGSGMAR